MEGANVPLGFEVDTGGLARGKAAAADLTTTLDKLADAMAKEETASRRASDAEEKVSGSRRKASEAAKENTTTTVRATDAIKDAGIAAEVAAGRLGTLTTAFAGASATIGAGNMGMGLTGALGGLSGAAGRLSQSLAGVTGAALGVTAGLAGLAAVGATVVYATAQQEEQFALLEARLKNVYGSAYVASAAFADIIELADKNALAIDATAESFLRLARNNEAIGLTRKEMVELTDAVQMLGRVSGASNGELQGGLMQFSQALAAGRLNGDELRSIMENMPALAKAIADGMGVSVGQMRALGAEGQLTSDKIVGALLGQLPEIREEFENLPQTSEQAFQRVANSWDRLIAGMGQRLNSSGILTGIASAFGSAIDGAADFVTPQTDQERLAELEGYVRELEALNQIPRERMSYDQVQTRGSLMRIVEGSEAERIGLAEAQRVLAMQARRQEEAQAALAPFTRSQGIVKEIDDLATKTGKLRSEIQTLQLAYDNFTRTPELFSPEAAAQIEQYPALIAALTTQLNGLRPVLADYENKTSNIFEDLLTYGAGGAASIGDEARGLVSSAAKAGQSITFDQAEFAVLERRRVELLSQTAAMENQITTQERMIEAIGQGTDAQIEAEVATKTYNLQMQLFGTDIGPAAQAALDGYADTLRRLLEIQKEATNEQRLYNAEVDLGIQRQINAAIAAGQTAGEVEALRRSLETARQLQEAGIGTGGAVPVIGGGVIPQDRVDGNTITSGLNADITAIVASVMATYPQVMGISGLRPHDDGSQHQLGTAFDLDLSGLDEGQRRALVEQLLSGAFGRIGGIGTYNDTATSLHVDTRDGRFAWGPNRSQTSLGQTPEWFEEMTRAWMAGETPMATGTGTLPLAILTEAQLAEERARQGDLARLAEIQRQTDAIISDRNAPDAVARREAEIARRADAAAASATPEMAPAIREAEATRLRAEDEAAYQERLRALEEETRLLNQQADLAGLPRREREIELETLRLINEELAAGRDVDSERAAEIRVAVAARIDASEIEEQAREDADRYRGIWEDAASGIGSAIESAVGTAARRGKIEAEELLTDLLADIATSITRAYVTKPLVDGIGTLIDSFAAHGAAYDGGVKVFAAGGVVDRPTVFPFARGVGLMGEAGPEAILPLKRGADGKLGVGAGGGSRTSITINDMRSAQGAEPVEVEETTGPDGERMISVMIRDEMRRQLNNGGVDQAMRNNYGIPRQMTRR